MNRNRPFYPEPSCAKVYKEAYHFFNNINIFEGPLRLKEMLK